MIDMQLMIWSLKELSSQEDQERLWLSDGSSGEVSSFEEAVCQLFDDAHISQALESGSLRELFGDDFCTNVKTLDELVQSMPQNMAPEILLRDPSLLEIRRICKLLLEIAYEMCPNLSQSGE